MTIFGNRPAPLPVLLCALMLAGCSAALHVPTTPLAGARPDASGDCLRAADGAPDERLAYAACMIANGYTAGIEVIGGGWAMPTAFMKVGHRLPPSLDQALADLTDCRLRARARVTGSDRAMIGLFPMSGVTGGVLGREPAALFTSCLQVKGYEADPW